MFILCWVQLLCSCLRPARPPAPCGRAWIWKQRFVAETRNTRSRTNKLIIMSAATGLTRSGLLAGGSQLDSDIVRPTTNSHLNVDARGSAPEVDLLYLTSWGCLVVDKYKDCSVIVGAVVHLNTDQINHILAILRSKDQQLLKRIEIEAV